MPLHCCASYRKKLLITVRMYLWHFVVYEKAFDRVHWPKLMEVLAKIGVDYRDRKMIWNLYMNQTASVMIYGELSDPGSNWKRSQTTRTVINNTLQYLC